MFYFIYRWVSGTAFKEVKDYESVFVFWPQFIRPILVLLNVIQATKQKQQQQE